MSVGHDQDAITQIVAGLASMTESEETDAEVLGKVATASIKSQFDGHSKAAAGAGVAAMTCRITRVSISCRRKAQLKDEEGSTQLPPRVVYQAGPIATGPAGRPPIRVGGGSCITVGSCTICYEYECS